MGYVVLTLIADGVFPPGVRRSVFFFNSSEYSTGDRFMAQLVQDSHLKIVKRGWEKKLLHRRYVIMNYFVLIKSRAAAEFGFMFFFF